MISGMAFARAPAGAQRAAAPSSPLRRRVDLGVLGGVCAGLAERFRVDVLAVRVFMTMIVVVGGVGVALYALAWALIPASPESREVGRRPGAWRQAVGVVLAVGAFYVALHLFVRGGGLPHDMGKTIVAVAIVGMALSLLLAPWVMRLGRSLTAERSARIREQERAELAAHLHDSVLQTLALIQRRASDPREVAGLARRQERELRHWLLEGRHGGEGDSVSSALERAAAEIEELHGVAIEVVTVGDGPLDERLEAMVQAAREALANAARFSGCERVDLYAEVERERAEVFVRDRGVGFDLASIPADRRGVRDSIVARMERHRGRAAVRTSPGAGTEVELVMERGA